MTTAREPWLDDVYRQALPQRFSPEIAEAIVEACDQPTDAPMAFERARDLKRFFAIFDGPEVLAVDAFRANQPQPLIDAVVRDSLPTTGPDRLSFDQASIARARHAMAAAVVYNGMARRARASAAVALRGGAR